jgi:uncharacterized lipoprotein YmbA
MKKLNQTKLAIIALLLLTACSVTKKSVTSDTMNIIKTDVVTKPQIADIEVESRKIEGFAEVRKKDYYPNPKEACVNLALKDATKKGNCDVVVQPMYEIEESGRYITVKVTGFAGSYKKFRAIQDADTSTFIAYGKISKAMNAEVAEPKQVNKARKFMAENNNKSGNGAGKGVLKVLGITSLILIVVNLITR